jgi:hypothetical protein
MNRPFVEGHSAAGAGAGSNGSRSTRSLPLTEQAPFPYTLKGGAISPTRDRVGFVAIFP